MVECRMTTKKHFGKKGWSNDNGGRMTTSFTVIIKIKKIKVKLIKNYPLIKNQKYYKNLNIYSGK